MNILTKLFFPDFFDFVLIAVLIKIKLLLVDGGVAHSKVELVDFLVDGYQKYHHRLVSLLDLHVVRNSLPITINIHTKLLLGQIINLVAWVLVLKSVGICY